MGCIERKITKFELLDNVWRFFHWRVLSKFAEYYRTKNIQKDRFGLCADICVLFQCHIYIGYL